MCCVSLMKMSIWKMPSSGRLSSACRSRWAAAAKAQTGGQWPGTAARSHADHDGILPAALSKENLCPTGVGKDLSDVGKNCSHCFVPFPSHKRRGVLGNAGVAPRRAAGTSSRLFLNAVNAADGQVFTQRGNGCSNGSNDLAGDGAVSSGCCGGGRSSLAMFCAAGAAGVAGAAGAFGGGFGAILFVLDGVKILLPQ